MSKISSDELPNRAFQLAYFLHCDRKTATEIATRALNKLELAATAQGKRLYYQLTGRLSGREDARKARSKVSLAEPHLLQRLVYVESEEYERRKEVAAQLPDADAEVTAARKSDLVVYFVKHLARITTKRNSFYVVLGLSRLLYNYTTPETMELYNLVVQDPERVHDDYYYRSRKAVLLKELKERFGALIEVAKLARGEQRWEAGAAEPRYAALVRECLFWFTPWATPCVVPERFDPLSDTIDQLNFQGRLADEEHEVEVNRIHAALHPECFARLAAANQLAAPDERLELPQFFISDDPDDRQDSSRQPPDLSADDLRTINDLLAQEASRRKAVRPTFFRVLVDGVERAETAGRRSAMQLQVDEGAEVIEVFVEDQQGPLLLAAHLLDFYGEPAAVRTITLEGGQQITFTVKLLQDESGVLSGADITVACKDAAPANTAATLARRVFGPWLAIMTPNASTPAWWRPVGAFALLALLIAGVWWTWSISQRPRQQVAVIPAIAPTATPSEVPGATPPALQVASPDRREQRSPTSPPANNTQPERNPTVSPRQLAENGSQSEHDESLVESTIVPDSAVDDAAGASGVRSWDPQVMGKPLSEVQRVYLQAASDGVPTQALLEQLRTRLNGSGNLRFADSEGADAALKISVRPASPRADEKRVIAIVRGVNANGYLVWPVSRRGASLRYVGRPPYVAERLVADLARDIKNAKRR